MSPHLPRLARAAGAALLGSLLLSQVALGAGPVRTVTSLDDASFDREESAYVTQRCGFGVTADVSGRWTTRVFRAGGRLVALNTYVTRVTYTAASSGRVVRLRDVYTERTFLRDGHQYRATTGRSVVLNGTVGRLVVSLADGKLTFSRGRTVGPFYNSVCSRLGATAAR